MYRNKRREGHDSIGTTTSATDYFLAEGTTAWGFTPRITPFMLPPNQSREPKSVVKVMMLMADRSGEARFGRRAACLTTARKEEDAERRS